MEFTAQADKDIAALKKSSPKLYEKVQNLLIELTIHPYAGIGKPKPLKGNKFGQWSRRISDKHRLVYSVSDKTITVLIISASGHYDDK
ncbi:MAG: Txe/YoeB family addiction module toxin [Tannerella sp.]|nr:Txe/YoeB family addiction module toxin [Tannerella sp.]